MYTNNIRGFQKKIMLLILSFVFVFSSVIQSNAATNSWVGSGRPLLFGNGQVGLVDPINTSSVTNVDKVFGGITLLSANGTDAIQTLFLKNDGTLWSAGINSYGQNGIGAASPFSTPAQVIGLTNVTHATSTGTSAYAISGGQVYSWGNYFNGRLGYAATSNQLTPQVIPGLTGITKVEAGNAHVVALRNDGTVWTWGAGNNHQLGLGSTSDVTLPTQVPGLTGITDIEATGDSTFAVNGSNQTFVWGANGSGFLGVAGAVAPFTPVTTPTISQLTDIVSFVQVDNVSGLPGFQGFFGGYATSGLVKYNGGNSSGATTGFATACPGNINCTSSLPANQDHVHMGNINVLSVSSAGVSTIGGSGTRGARSDGTYPNVFTNLDISAQVGGVPDEIAAIGSSYYAVMPSGGVQVWGSNYYGQLGVAGTPKAVDELSPEEIVNSTDWIDVESGQIAVDSSGDVYFWGFNGFSGNGVAATNSYIGSPVQVPGLSNIVELTQSLAGYLALDSSGDVWGWGRNHVDQLGIPGATAASVAPTKLPTLDAPVITKIHGSSAIDNAGNLWSWGFNPNGRIGDGTTTQNDTPQIVDTNVVDVHDGGFRYKSFVKADGTAWSSGAETSGCVGLGGSTNNILTHTQIPTLSNIIQVDRCTWIDSSGQVFRTGLTPVGDGTDQERLTPVPVNIPGGASDANLLAAISNTGDVYRWTSPDSLSPVQISTLSNGTVVSDVAGFFIRADIDDPLQTSDIPGLTITCDDAVESQTTTCTFSLPPNTSLPVDFVLGVGNATPAGACTADAAGLVTCITVPVGSDQNGALDPEQQDIFGAVGTDTPVDTGEDANVFSSGGDADGDGISNEDELTTTGTDPFSSDTDGDGLPDGWEVDNGLDPNDPTGDNGADGDADGDGLLNSGEYLTQFDPNDADSDSAYTTATDENDNTVSDCDEDIDGDNISNCDEIANGLDPLFANIDTDGDGIPDDWEIANGLDPNDPNDANSDLDGDGATNLQEYTLGTDPNDADSDSIRTPGVDENDNTVGDCDEDFDNDGLSNCGEFAAGTDPFNPDSDGDGLPDGYEVDNGLDPTSATGDNGPDGDPDGDGLVNRDEFTLGFNANNRDSDSTLTTTNEAGNGTSDCDEDNDGDGATNCDEIAAGTDPLDPNSTPTPTVTVPTTTPRTGGVQIAIAIVGLGILIAGVVVNQKRKKVKVKTN